ncbi:hypothetical protein Q5762_09625 [Streptomyces sp. P9(2023)]|uniref:hypothetical protein n=1 Tax=Streptomyces sp. P9(2023) TaxID=3064394 RepID=UPI0028F3F36A|nr:hypothetical protein [Streptomyces sp. P9(2023)]MDT9688607.1 hypothetical protein [Streptomyces sp. P9(2023)]
MIDLGGSSDTPVRRSRLADYADMPVGPQGAPTRATDVTPDPARAGWSPPSWSPPSWSPPPPSPGATREAEAEAGAEAEAEAAARREFEAVLELFRATAVLVPRRDGAWLTVDFGGVRWILAFSDGSALARYAVARGEGGLEWQYETVLGARLLDVAVPSAGVACGVALDAADGAEHAVLFPPVAGVVPDAVAVDGDVAGATERGAAR